MKMKRFLALFAAAMMLFSATVTGMAAEDAKTFTDVPAEHWAYPYVTALSTTGVISGYPDGSFRPDATVTRAEWAKMLSVAGELQVGKFEENFVDVNESDWYAPYASVVMGRLPYSRDADGNAWFLQEEAAEREDVTVSTVAAKGYILETADTGLLSAFTDAGTITEKFEPYMAFAVENGLVTGFEDNTLRPQATLTRAEAATLLYRAFFAEGAKAPAAVDPAEEAAIRSVVDGYYTGLKAWDIPAMLEYIAKDSELYRSTEAQLKSEEQYAKEAMEDYGMSEAQSRKYAADLLKFEEDIAASSQYEIQSVTVDGDYAQASVRDMMLDTDTSTASRDYKDYMTAEERNELEQNAQTMTEEEYLAYAYDLVNRLLPIVYDAILETSQVTASDTQVVLQKIDGSWKIIDDR